MFLRRILGLVMLLIGVLGIGLSIAGAVYGYRLVDNVGDGLKSSLDLTSQSLDTVKETLLLAQTTVGQVNDGLDTVTSAVTDLSQTISQTRPLLGEITQIISHDVSNSVEAVQTAVPYMAQAAAAVDDTLTILSNLRIEQQILGFPIRFDLGIEYAPEVSFEESINQAGHSLEGVPPRLRGLEVYMDTANDNLERISQDVLAMSRDLDTISNGITDVAPLLDDYVRIVTEINDSIRQTRASLSQQLYMVKLVVTMVMVWIGLTQVAPLYLGWELVTGRRSIR
jgi:ABC-type transporter Mla subunit MlaD